MHSCDWMQTIIQALLPTPSQPQSLPSPALPPSIHSIQSTASRLNKHITKLKYLQVSLISIQPLSQPVSMWIRWAGYLDAGRVLMPIWIKQVKALRLCATSPVLPSPCGSAAHMPECQAWFSCRYDKCKFAGIPDACTLPGTLIEISMHTTGSLLCTKQGKKKSSWLCPKWHLAKCYPILNPLDWNC